MSKHLQSTLQLNNGVQMPQLGLGVFKISEGEDVVNAVKAAIKHGYRSIDTAAAYNNEEGVGQAIKEALAENGLSREDLFITTKVWNSMQGYETTLQAFDTSIQKLGLEYIDLYLVHWPVKGKYKETYRALEEIYRSGRVRAIGVSNFQTHHLDDLMQDATVVPAVNQVELHPYLTQEPLREYCAKKGIVVEAWSPLGQSNIINDEVIGQIAGKYGKTPAQVILRWDLQIGIVTIPKSVKEQRIVENADLYDFELSAEDMAVISGLNKNHRFGPDPDNFNF